MERELIRPHHKKLIEDAWVTLSKAGRDDCADALSALLGELGRVSDMLTCWCGGPVDRRTPGDGRGLGCTADIHHDWAGGNDA